MSECRPAAPPASKRSVPRAGGIVSILALIATLGAGTVVAVDLVGRSPAPTAEVASGPAAAPREPRLAASPRVKDRVEWQRARAGRSIPVFEIRGEDGNARADRSALAARLDRLVLFQSAAFDPVAEGEPDFSAFLPSVADRSRSAARWEYDVVQLKGVVRPEDRAALEATGASIVEYVPNNAFVVRVSPETRGRLDRTPGVRWRGRFLPGYKVETRLMREAAGLDLPHGPEPTVRLLVAFFPAEDPAPAMREAGSLGGRVHLASDDPSDPVVDLEIPYDRLNLAVRALASIEGVAWVQRRPRWELNNNHSIWVGQSYDTANGPTEAAAAAPSEYPTSGTIWKRDILGNGQIVAVSDSGLDRDHNQFRDTGGCPVATQAVVPPAAVTLGTQRKLAAYNVPPGATAGDNSSAAFHGTHTSGSVAGDSVVNASTATTAGHDGGDGMAPQARLLFEDVGEDATGALSGIPTRVQDLWAQERASGAFISSNSWGVGCPTKPCGDYTYESKMSDRFVWENPDFLILYSSGNSGSSSADGSQTHSDKNVLTVGATVNGSDASRANNLGTYSSRGPAADGRIKPDITAPGSSVTSASGTADPPNCATPSTGTKGMTGTSMSCPTAAGLAALARQYFTEGWYPTGSKTPANAFVPSAALMKAALINGAMNMTGSAVGGDSPNFDQGWGRIQLDNVLYFNDGFGTDARKTRLWDVPVSKGLLTGDVDSYKVRVATGQTLKVTLAWTDPAAAPYSSQNLVNNLDLEVVGPTGNVYKGNIWTDGGGTNDKFSTANSLNKDDVNNVEGVLLATSLPAGEYTIRVKGYNVPGAGTQPFAPTDPTVLRQGYALVVTGNLDLSAGSVWFSNRSFGCGSSDLTVHVYDDAVSPSTVALVNSATGDAETVTLGGTRPHWVGSIPLAFNLPAAAADGTLQVGDNSAVTATYVDAFTTTATASIGSCAPNVVFRSHLVSGGCDGDKYLDANETANLAVTIRNGGLSSLANLTGTLTTSTSGVVIGTDAVNFGTVAAGAVGTNATPFVLSALGVAAGTPVTFTLSFVADGFTKPATVSFSSWLEQDVATVTNQTVTMNLDGASGFGNEVSPPCAADRAVRWTTFDASVDPSYVPVVLTTCDTGAPTPTRILAFTASASGPCLSPGGACNNYADEKAFEIQSPWIGIAPAGSTFVSGTLKQLRYSYKFDFPDGNLANPGGDYSYALLFDPGFNFLFVSPSYFDKDSPEEDGTWRTLVVDLTKEDLDDLLDLSQVGIDFFLNSANDGNNSAGIARLDDIRLTFDGEGRIADVTSCSLPCTAPAAPTGVAASNVAGGVQVSWTPVGGAGEYHVFRSTAGCGGSFAKIAETTEASYLDASVVNGSSYAYVVRSADATGACESAASNCSTVVAASGTCRSLPSFGGVTLASSDNAASCGITLTFGTGTSACGGGVTYNVYRSTSAGFTPGLGNLLASGLAGGPYVDSQVQSLTRYYYVVRAVDSLGNVDSNLVTVAATTSGPKTAGTFADNAEIPDVFTMNFPWTRSPNQNHEAGGTTSYRSGAGGASATYPSQTCGALVTPEIELMPSGTSTLTFWHRYDIEVDWDGVVVEVATAAGGFSNWTTVGSGAFYPGTFSQTNQCNLGQYCAGQQYCNECCYPQIQPGFNGPATNGSLTAWVQASTNDLTTYNGQVIKVRFNLSSDPGAEFQGMYVDEIRVVNAATPSACTPGACPNGPTFYGLVSANDLSASADTGVRLTWLAPSSWGSGAAGNFLVYRDGALIATLGSGVLAYDDLGGTNGVSHVYEVVAVNGCGRRAGESSRTAADMVVFSGPFSPAEASRNGGTPMLAEKGAGSSIEIVQFGVGCATDSTSLYWGSLPVTASYGWTSQQCANATTGTVTFTNPLADSFFVIVGANGDGFEGSYGHDSSGGELLPKSGACATYDLGIVCN